MKTLIRIVQSALEACEVTQTGTTEASAIDRMAI